jgi:hypothetical protein
LVVSRGLVRLEGPHWLSVFGHGIGPFLTEIGPVFGFGWVGRPGG